MYKLLTCVVAMTKDTSKMLHPLYNISTPIVVAKLSSIQKRTLAKCQISQTTEKNATLDIATSTPLVYPINFFHHSTESTSFVRIGVWL